MINNLERTIEKSGFKNGEIAKLLGKSPAWFSQVKAGKIIPTLEDAFRMAFLLDIKVDDLFKLNFEELSILEKRIAPPNPENAHTRP
jgi:transcriptional regulator with XRE-family HTH domain